jgi:hypothetical protein
MARPLSPGFRLGIDVFKDVEIVASGIDLGFHLLRRAGYDEMAITDIARVMEYQSAYEQYRDDLERAQEGARRRAGVA